MNENLRTVIIAAIAVAIAWFLCVFTPFTLLPSLGISPAMPVIEVPGEVVYTFGSINLTNTIIGTIVSDILVLLYAFLAWRATKGWTTEIPGKFQAWVEVFWEAYYDFCYNIGGERLRTTPLLWPIIATMFVLILTGNWLKLLPGVESVGRIHCAYPGQSGYPRQDGAAPGTYLLYVDRPIYAGDTASEETESSCRQYLSAVAGIEYVPLYSSSSDEDHGGEEAEEAAATEGEEAEATATDGDAEAEESAVEEEAAEESALAGIRLVVEEEPVDEEAAGAFEAAVAAALVAADDATDGEVDLELLAAAETAFDTLEAPSDEAQAELEALQLATTQAIYPDAYFALDSGELESGRIAPYIFTITPFVRGPATDLSFTFALAIFAVVLVQVYGVWALGPAYFFKFVNFPALANIGKNPIGGIDFVVGLIEIISEIGKIVSLAFRLFGNLFAGGIVLMVFPFLLALVVPGVMIGLEIIIGLVQALVFGVLTLVFSVQAMEAHHGDDHDDHH